MKLTIPKTVEEQHSYWSNPRRSPRPESFVYVIQADGDAAVKVGVARDVKKRVSSLQTGNPRPLRLRALLVGGRELERELHDMLKSAKVMGEWFAGPDIEPFLEMAQSLAMNMLTAYQATKRVPDFRQFPPFSERIKLAEANKLPSITPEQLKHRGRLSGIPRRSDPDLAQRQFREAQREPAFSPHRSS